MKLYFFPIADRRIHTNGVREIFPNAEYKSELDGGKGGYIVEVESMEQLQKILQQTTDEGQGGCLHIRLNFYRRPNEDGVSGSFYLAC